MLGRLDKKSIPCLASKNIKQSHLVATKHMKKKSAAIWLKFGLVGGIGS